LLSISAIICVFVAVGFFCMAKESRNVFDAISKQVMSIANTAR
jgi:hypothetical protein